MRFCPPLRYGKDKQILRICKTAWADAAARAARPLRGLGWRCRPSPVATPRSGPDEHRKPTWARTCKASAKEARGCRASAEQTPAQLDRPENPVRWHRLMMLNIQLSVFRIFNYLFFGYSDNRLFHYPILTLFLHRLFYDVSR